MRITGFHVDGFGLLHDQAVDGIEPGITVVLGPNEAGKSTLHAFLVRTLFGHPRSNDAAARNRHEPLRGGRHGGVVRCEDDRGRWEVHRSTEGSPRLRVVAPDGSESTGTDATLDLLGRTVDEARYEQVFAIDLDDLAGVGSLGGGALDDLLFDAATVGTGRSLRAARDEAVERRDALWTPSATKRPLALALRRRTEARTRLTAAQDAARANLDTRRRLDAAAARVEDLGRRQLEQQARTTLLERVRDAWPAWSRAAELRTERDGLPDVVADPGSVAAARTAAAALEQAEAEATRLREERDRVAAEVAGLELDEEALVVADDTEALAEGLGVHELAVEQLAAATRAADDAERAVAAALADLGPGWDQQRVRAVAVDAPVRQRLEAAGDDLLEAELRADAARERAEEAARVAARRREAVEQRRAEAPSAPQEQEVTAAEQAVAVLRRGLPVLAPGALQPAASPAGAGWPAVAMVVLAASLALTAALGAVPEVVPDWLTVTVVAVLVGVSTYALGSTRGTAPTAPTAAAGEVPTLAGDVAAAAAAVGLPEQPSLAQVEQVAARVEAARAARRQAAEVARQVATLEAEAEDAAGVAATAGQAADEREVAHAAARATWEEACGAVGLEADGPVRVVLTRHDRVATVRRTLDDREAAAEVVARVRPRVDDFRADAGKVAAALGHDATDQAAVRLLGALRDRVRAARAARLERNRAAERRDALDRALAGATELATAAAQDLAEAWTAVGARDPADLEHRAEVATRRAELDDEAAAAERAVTQLLGSGPRGEEGRALLRTADPTAWEQELAAARAAVDTLTAERDGALAERTELEGRLRDLGGDDAVPRAAQELATAELEVGELAERWAVADTAARLLEETVARFEREQQPRVLTRASELFARATGGQWAQVRRLEGQVVVARSEGGDPVAASVLSRGTREQLWLCLRLALAEDLSHDRPLPLLVDDLLGTSDPERSLHVARVLAEVGRRQQVWLFTCHPRTADLVTSTDPTAGVLRLRRGGRVAGLSRRAVAAADGESELRFDV